MNSAALNKFMEAHDRYLELDRIRVECQNAVQRESVHIAILKAYLEVQYRSWVFPYWRLVRSADICNPSSYFVKQ